MLLYGLLTNLRDADPSDVFNHVSVTAFVSFEEAAAKLYDWYNGQTGDVGEIYHSEWRVDKDGHRWFNPHFAKCEIRQIYFYSEKQ
jgi:hypothetical protein